jgi:hypothetical protein
MAGDVLEEREKGMALRVHSQNRADLIKFYKALGAQDGKHIPPEMKRKEAESKALERAQSIMEERSARRDSLALAAFLIDRGMKVREIVLKKDSLSLYSLFVSLRNRLCDMLGPGYYEKSGKEVMDDYLDIEPLVAACSELCGLSMPSIDEIVSSYRS